MMLKLEYSDTNRKNKMIINNLEQMEKIVAKNKSLSWDGWNVVELIKSSSAMYKPEGIFSKGSWYIKKTFDLNREGWKVPNKYVR